MSSEQTVKIAAIYLRELLEVVNGFGIDPEPLYQSLGFVVPEDNDQLLELPVSQLEHILITSQSLTQSALLSFQVGQRLFLNSHGMIGYALMNSANFTQLSDSLQQFLPFRTDCFTLSHQTINNEYRVKLHAKAGLGLARQWLLETGLVALKNIYDFTAMGESPVSYIAFESTPPEVDKTIQSLVKAKVYYEKTWTGFAFAKEVIHKPLKIANPENLAHVTKLCLETYPEAYNYHLISDNVRRLLVNSVGNFPSLESTAVSLNLTPRTLHRRLVGEGSSYKTILKETRQMLAKHYLSHSKLSIEAIAYMLGYDNPSNFRRAFKVWTQITPRNYRRIH